MTNEEQKVRQKYPQAEQHLQPEFRDGASQGLCDTTMTPRFLLKDCNCGTYKGNLGPCRSWLDSGRGRCTYCDHQEVCHIKILQAHAIVAQPASSAKFLARGIMPPLGDPVDEFMDAARGIVQRYTASSLVRHIAILLYRKKNLVDAIDLLKSQVAPVSNGSNYVANKECRPTEVRFENSRRVYIKNDADGPFLEVEMMKPGEAWLRNAADAEDGAFIGVGDTPYNRAVHAIVTAATPVSKITAMGFYAWIEDAHKYGLKFLDYGETVVDEVNGWSGPLTPAIGNYFGLPTPVSGAQELTRVRAEIYANPTYLAGLLMRIKTAYFEKEWKAVERLFEAEIEEMEKRRPTGAQEFECPVCYWMMVEPASAYNICPRCGTEFENDDFETSHELLRKSWIKAGCKFFSRAAVPVDPLVCVHGVFNRSACPECKRVGGEDAKK